MKPHGKMQVANLGDSGVRVIRDGKIIFASAVRKQGMILHYELHLLYHISLCVSLPYTVSHFTLQFSQAQQHMFNMPYQLSHPSIIESPDDADCADVSIVDVQPGDVVVMATDGERWYWY